MRKATDSQIIQAYNQTRSIWKAAEILNMGGQSVHERLIKLGIPLKLPRITEEEIEKIKSLYVSGIKKGDGKLKKLSVEISRTIPFICRYAGKIGLTSNIRENSIEQKVKHSEIMKNWLSLNTHPRGFSGQTHNVESIAKISIRSLENWAKMTDDKKSIRSLKMLKTKIENNNLSPTTSRVKASWKCGWREISGKKLYFRSSWEFIYATFLQLLKETGQILNWMFEPDTFLFEKESRAYIPDFKVFLNNGYIEYHEVKGWLDDRSKLKIELFTKYKPELILIIIDYKWFKNNQIL